MEVPCFNYPQIQTRNISFEVREIGLRRIPIRHPMVRGMRNTPNRYTDLLKTPLWDEILNGCSVQNLGFLFFPLLHLTVKSSEKG